MKYQGWLSILIFLTSMILLSGCTMFQPQFDTEGLELTADKFVQLLEELESTAEYIAAQTDAVMPTLPPIATFEPTETKRPTQPNTLTPTRTATATITPVYSSVGQVYLSGDTNCRTGPGKSYDWVTLLHAGLTLPIIGQDRDQNYWVVQDPGRSDVCWLWKAFTTPVGTFNRIPVFASPPTKTPTRTPSSTPEPRFSIKLEQIILCNGQESMVIRVYNSSPYAFRSWRANIFNSPGRIPQTAVDSDQFSHDKFTCEQTISSLASRRTGYAIVPFDSSQAQDFLVEFEACTHPGKRGVCAFDGIKFNIQFLTATPTNTATPTITPTPTKTPTITPSPTTP